MKILLLRDCRIRHNAGEVVEASPAEAAYLLSTSSAVEIRNVAPARETPETITAEAPEDLMETENPEARKAPETRKATKTTRKK